MNKAQLFRQMAMDRGRRLRDLPFSRLAEMTGEPSEEVTFGARQGTVSVIVERWDDARLRVVVQGFLKWSWLPVKSVALYGFYKQSGGSITEMRDAELYGHDY